MELNLILSFWQEFTFDTVIALISCIAGVIALFLGGAAYKKCEFIKKSFNDRKEFGDDCTDKSQKAAGDIYNYGCNEEQLELITQSMTTLTTMSFSKTIDMVYENFRLQSDANMKNILQETRRMIQDNKLQIAGYTKLDWINIYFESAKNTSDTYMQKVWAKVLAHELSQPDSFSYKTLDVLKNMSSKEFILFEKLANLQVENVVLKDESKSNRGLEWVDFQKLAEFGLINLKDSKITKNVSSNSEDIYLLGESYVYILKNNAAMQKEIEYPCYLLTSVAKELLNILDINYTQEYVTAFAKELKAKAPKDVSVSLHQVYALMENGQVSYGNKDLLEAE